MPGINLHFVLADRVLSERPAILPDRADLAAFLFGAMSPDMGYMPGGSRFVSDLVHLIHSGQMSRSLLQSATAGPTRAFALGWATHVLADAIIHPLINRAAAEIVGSPAGSLTFADDPITHIRVEQGLDAVVGSRFIRSAATRMIRPRMPDELSHWLDAAHEQTYGLPLTKELRRSCQALNRAIPALFRYAQWAAWWLGDSTSPTPGVLFRSGFQVLRAAARFFPGSVIFGFTHPIFPPKWLLSDVTELIDNFSQRFAALEANHLADLVDYNLDTGEVNVGEDNYRLTRAAIVELAFRLEPRRLVRKKRRDHGL